MYPLAKSTPKTNESQTGRREGTVLFKSLFVGTVWYAQSNTTLFCERALTRNLA